MELKIIEKLTGLLGKILSNEQIQKLVITAAEKAVEAKLKEELNK